MTMKTTDDIKKIQKGHYDELSADYVSKIDPRSYNYYFKFTLEAVMNALESHFHNLSEIAGLDVGCGNGDFSVALAESCRHITGVDLSTGMIEMANKTNQSVNVSFAASPSDRLNFQDLSFEFSSSIHLFHHLADPNLIKATLREMKRVTKRGGIIVIVDVNKLNPLSFYSQYLMVSRGVDTGQERLVYPSLLKKLFRELDIEFVSHKGFCFVPHIFPRLKKYNDYLGTLFPHRFIGKDYLIIGKIK
jgi:ubiquinone/menaquinone biosynthesis C-methylase UbiE